MASLVVVTRTASGKHAVCCRADPYSDWVQVANYDSSDEAAQAAGELSSDEQARESAQAGSFDGDDKVDIEQLPAKRPIERKAMQDLEIERLQQNPATEKDAAVAYGKSKELGKGPDDATAARDYDKDTSLPRESFQDAFPKVHTPPD
jgi:hypothetical protein